MTGNQVVSMMFDFNICNHIDRFVLQDNRNEDPRYNHMDLGYDGVFMSLH
jgi:hypothetical protein